MATNDTKMGRNCNSNNEKHNSNIPTALWPPPQRAKNHSVFRYTTLSDRREFNCIPTILKKK